MKIGICTSVENIKKMEAMGYDYIEPAVAGTAGMTEEDFLKAEEMVSGSGIRCEAFNVLFPGDIKLTGPVVDKEKISAYLEKAFDRIHRLGAEVVVFGSGGARRVPEGFAPEAAFDQLVEAARLVGDVAARYGLTIAIEPLNTGETNIINSVAEGLHLVQTVDHPQIKLLADFYHMRMENEGMDVLRDTGKILRHTHIANSNGRIYPQVATEDTYDDFFACLKAGGYAGRMSVEAGTKDVDKDGPVSLKLLRDLSQ